MLDQFRFIGKKLFEEGLVSSHSGNLSIREENRIIITRTGSMLSDLKEDDLVEVALNGERDDKISVDLQTHRLIYSSCNVRAIVHAKPSFAMIVAISEEKIIPLDFDGKQFLKAIPVVRVRDPHFNEEINKFLIPAFKNNYPCSVIRGYGSFSVGNTLMDSYKYVSMAESSCKMVHFAKKPDNGYFKREDKLKQGHFRSAIPPSIGVMDRSYRKKR